MNLNLFEVLKNEIESNKGISKFIKELSEELNKKNDDKEKNQVNEEKGKVEEDINSLDIETKESDLLQNREELEKYRKEGHLYLITEDRNGKVFLWDLTDKPKNEIEEIDFPRELISKATEGSVFKYTNGTYEFYSEDGYDILFNE